MQWRRRSQRTPKWRGGADFRIVCDCQLHRRRALWRRVASRALPIVVSVPLAFFAFDFPVIEAMNTTPSSLSQANAGATVMPMFTTQRMRDQFFDPQPQALTLEIAKEEFFRTHVPYGAIIYREARRNRLAPELVAAIVQTESDFRVGLVSYRKAQGLMQIVPETAEILGVKNPFDPNQNIAAGTRYLRYLMDRFPDQRLALAAYNAGETKVARLGTIPEYEETRAYVEKVNERTRSYQLRVRRSYLAASRIRVAF